jgi:hypothetical protein
MANIEDTTKVKVGADWKPCSAMQIFVVTPVSIVDSYSESNQDSQQFFGITTVGIAQAFTGDGGTLNSAKWYLKKDSGATGIVVAKIYDITGTFGTDAKPTGSALATSDNYDVSSIGTTFELITFTFSGINKITLVDTTQYCLAVEYTSGDSKVLYWGF